MRELREDTFSGNKNDDAHEHVERILDIISLFNIPRVTHDAVMLRVFPITLTGAAKRWLDRFPTGTINIMELLKKAFIQRYCPSSKTAKQLEEIHNFKPEGDETLYQAWERYNVLLYKCPTHDLNSHQKVNIFHKGLDTMTHQLLDLQGSIPNKTPAQALDAIQTMADHSQKWHNGSTNRKVSNGSLDGIATITSKLDSLRRDMKKLKENVHAIQVGCETCKGARLNKECPLHEDIKSVEEVKYGEFGRPFPNNNGNGARYRIGPPGYYTRVDNRPPFGEKKPSLEELMNKHLEESTRRRAKMEDWMTKLQESTNINTRNQNASLKNLETQIEQLAKDCQAKAAKEVIDSSIGQCKAIFANNEAPADETSYN
ncbi:hypothetical protein Tco_0394301 [Tanacetum coccineum]